jgi:membrane associated rhomboid family serine protease
MLPVRDSIPTRRFPIVNYTLILINVLVFVYMWFLGSSLDSFVYQHAMIPANAADGVSFDDLLDVFTSMFMHAGFAHIAGNMLYLWIFGDNVEDRLGHGRYFAFYVVGGVLASVAHLLADPMSDIPTVGASGAIAAVLGAYLVLFPYSRVSTFVPLGFLYQLTVLPAGVVLGLWFLLQLFSSVLALGGADLGNVAFAAHVGGFVAGVVMALPFRRRMALS